MTSKEDLGWWLEIAPLITCPVIVLTQMDDDEFLAAALDAGVDGFAPSKVFSPLYFEAQIKSVFRRKGSIQEKDHVTRLNLTFDNHRSRVERDGKVLELTLTEFKILRELATKEPLVISRLEMQAKFFGGDQNGNRSLDVHVCALRKKLKEHQLKLESVRGVGYQMRSITFDRI